VATNRWTLIVAMVLILVSAGCNSGSTSNVTNPAPPPQQGVSIAFQSTPPSSVVVGGTASLTAVVTNDSSNAGVDWSLTCANGNCGSLSTSHTSSGQPVTYTAPSNMPGNAEVVNIAAFATADHSQNVLTSINVTAYGSNLMGTYVLEVQGFEGGSPYQLVATIVLDGNGNVTSGEQTVNLVDLTGTFNSYSGSISASGSSYFLGPDGRGTLTINPGSSFISLIGQETFTLAYLSNASVLIAATPNSTSPSGISASGSMDLQTSTTITTPAGGYAFVMGGTDFNGAGPVSIGGIFNVNNLPDNPNNISGAGSIADENVFETLYPNIPTSGSISVPDQFGAVNLSFALNNPSLSTPSINLKGYIVDATHIKLIEDDQAGTGSVAGLALGQGSSTGSLTTFSGTYVFGLLGVDFTTGLPDTFTSAGVVTANGAGDLTNGYADTAFQALTSPVTGLPAAISGTFEAVYNTSPNGIGRFPAFLTGFPTPNGPYHPELIFYLTGPNSPALVLGYGNTTATYPFPFSATGIAYPQANGPFTFSGSYGLYFAQQNGTEFDGTAEMNVSSSSFSGVTDVGSDTDQAFTGTVSSQSCSSTVSGCFSGTFANGSGETGFQGTNLNNSAIAFAADFYMIDSTQGFFVETDLQQQALPQVSLGYFAASTLPSQAAAKIKTGTKVRK
jgi:hypothetical protein